MAMIEPFRPLSRRRRVSATLIGAFVVLYIASCLLTKSYGAAFFSIPLFVGFIAGMLFPKSPFMTSLCSMLVALALSIITMREGVICVLFSIPVLLPMLWLGAFVGSTVVRHVHTERARRSGAWVALLLGLGSQVWARLTDDPAQHPLHVAEAEIVIDAPPEAVFELLTTRELRVASRWPWFVRIGLPMPERMLVEQPQLGGQVRFDFHHGSAFARITGWQPGRELRYAIASFKAQDLPFHITRLGRGPDYGFRSERVEDWLTIRDTRYTLAPGAHGGTLLRRRVVWQRHLAPALYFGWLQQTVMERAQVRLLELVRDRAASDRSGRTICALTPAGVQGLENSQ
jgi:uncharacterized protein YndB with AHSA1/START domain